MLQGRGKLPMSRPTKADELGLVLNTSVNRGKWRAVIATPAGEVIFDKDGYVSEPQAKQGANRFLKANYEAPAVITPVAPAPKPREAQTTVWQRRIAKEADDMEAKAVDMRERANTLEAEAKRLRAAADILAEL